MGLAASQARFLQLTARKSDIEYKGQQVNQERTINAHNMEKLVEQMQQLSADGLLDDPNYSTPVQAQLDQKHAIDSTLELELRNLDTQQNEVQTEVDAVSKVIDKNIDMTFKTFA
jgi:hypothetical protein